TSTNRIWFFLQIFTCYSLRQFCSAFSFTANLQSSVELLPLLSSIPSDQMIQRSCAARQKGCFSNLGTFVSDRITTAKGCRPTGHWAMLSGHTTDRSRRAPKHVNFLVIGGGSGGIAAACRAAEYGVSVAIIEKFRMGGTCVNVGCIPKKLMYYAGVIHDTIHDAEAHGFSIDKSTWDWANHSKSRSNYISRLNSNYIDKLSKLNISYVNGTAAFLDAHTVVVGDTLYTADHILIAVGAEPAIPHFEGSQHCVTSDTFFNLPSQPKKPVVIGAGYIAVELAGILNSLGSNTTLVIRGETALRKFDNMLSTALDAEMKRQGIRILKNSIPTAVRKLSNGKFEIKFKTGEIVSDFDCVLAAIGRKPSIDRLNLQLAGINVNQNGFVEVDEYQNTNQDRIYAIGDVSNKIQLTPVAIAAGRKLSDRLFGGLKNARISYEKIPTVIFSHPPIGTVGLTEEEAISNFGKSNVTIYESSFVNLYYGLLPCQEQKPRSRIKIICSGPQEKLVGIHIIGMAADEILQGFAVALNSGLSKSDLDKTVAIHPTAAEEVVTMRSLRN
ncbi:glutathione reductase, partial [Cardiosporidium cionae]